MKALAALTVFLLAAACGSESEPGGSTSPGPEDAVEQLLTSLEAGSCADVKEIVVTPSTIDCEMIESLEGSFADEGVDLADVTYTAGEVVADSGTVTVDWGDDDAEESWNVERVDGTWKVVFDSVE